MAYNYTLYNGANITATGNGSSVAVPPGATVAVNVLVFSATGTTPSITFEIQWSVDGGNWASADGTADTFAAITTVKNAAKNVTVKGSLMRLAWTVSGTTPNFSVQAFITEVDADRD